MVQTHQKRQKRSTTKTQQTQIRHAEKKVDLPKPVDLRHAISVSEDAALWVQIKRHRILFNSKKPAHLYRTLLADANPDRLLIIYDQETEKGERRSAAKSKQQKRRGYCVQLNLAASVRIMSRNHRSLVPARYCTNSNDPHCIVELSFNFATFTIDIDGRRRIEQWVPRLLSAFNEFVVQLQPTPKPEPTHSQSRQSQPPATERRVPPTPVVPKATTVPSPPVPKSPEPTSATAIPLEKKDTVPPSQSQSSLSCASASPPSSCVSTKDKIRSKASEERNAKDRERRKKPQRRLEESWEMRRKKKTTDGEDEGRGRNRTKETMGSSDDDDDSMDMADGGHHRRRGWHSRLNLGPPLASSSTIEESNSPENKRTRSIEVFGKDAESTDNDDDSGGAQQMYQVTRELIDDDDESQRDRRGGKESIRKPHLVAGRERLLDPVSSVYTRKDGQSSTELEEDNYSDGIAIRPIESPPPSTSLSAFRDKDNMLARRCSALKKPSPANKQPQRVRWRSPRKEFGDIPRPFGVKESLINTSSYSWIIRRYGFSPTNNRRGDSSSVLIGDSGEGGDAEQRSHPLGDSTAVVNVRRLFEQRISTLLAAERAATKGATTAQLRGGEQLRQRRPGPAQRQLGSGSGDCEDDDADGLPPPPSQDQLKMMGRGIQPASDRERRQLKAATDEKQRQLTAATERPPQQQQWQKQQVQSRYQQCLLAKRDDQRQRQQYKSRWEAISELSESNE